MSDLDDLRTALRAEPAEEFGPVDVLGVMKAGRRIRTRRRMLLGGGVVGATAAVLVVVMGISQFTAVPPPVPEIVITAAAQADPSTTPLGAVVRTGLGDEVLYLASGVYALGRDGELVDSAGYALILGHTDTAGKVQPSRTTPLESRAAGFHAVTFGDGTRTGVYGVYKGPVNRIVFEVGEDGQVVASTAKWSADPEVVVFWISAEDLQFSSQPAAYRLVAYDEEGNILPF